jgi:ssDNA-binding replication factor A large subunit
MKDTKGEFMINARIQLDPEANRILNMFKSKYDLKDKSEAINKFVLVHSKVDEYDNLEVKDEYIYKMEKEVSKFLKSNPKFKSMTKKEFDDIFKK